MSLIVESDGGTMPPTLRTGVIAALLSALAHAWRSGVVPEVWVTTASS
jgi:hypothetical protein